MTRLEKYLLNEAKGVTHSQTTMSRYIAIDNLIIRLSDHYSIEANVDIQIIYSVNKSDIYSVFVKGNTKILHYNGKQIKEFIKSYALIKEMCSITRPPKEEVKEEEKEEDIYVIEVEPSRLSDHNLTKNQLIIKNKPVSLWNPSELGYLKDMILKECGRVNSWSLNFQKFLRDTKVSYLEAITLYKTLVRQQMQFTIPNLEYMLKRLNTRN